MQGEFYKEKKVLCVVISAAMTLACLFGNFSAGYADIPEVSAQEIIQTTTAEVFSDTTLDTTAETEAAVTTPAAVTLPVTTPVTTTTEVKPTEPVTTSYICIIVTSLAATTYEYQEHSYLSIAAPDESQCYVGNTFRIKYSAICPPSLYDEISWRSSDKEVAVIDSNGYVTITGVGTVTISGSNGHASDSVTFSTWEKPAETPPVTTIVTIPPMIDDIVITTQLITTSVTDAPDETDLPVETTIIRGDVSENGEIDLYDAIAICQNIMGIRDFTDEERKNADFNGDGVVDLYDAIAIAKKLME